MARQSSLFKKCRLPVALALSLFGHGAVACEAHITGPNFISVAGPQGMNPRQGVCAEVNTAGNSFWAMPNLPCELFFGDADWLRPGMTFVRLNGGGKFDQYPEPGGIRISIKPAKGFVLTGVVVETGNPDRATCANMQAQDVLR